jgi:glycosyltransferase involved in cell wall biosynthesis
MKNPLPHASSLSVVVPVYNEAAALLNFLPELVQTCQEKGWVIIVVDDGSTDDSGRVLAAYEDCGCLKIIRHKVNRGYGRALKTGILSARTAFVTTMDGDGQHCVSDIEATFHYALETDADLVVGKRSRCKNASPVREFGKKLIRTFTQILMPLPIHDLNSGFKLYRTKLVQKYIPLCPNSMAFSDVITLAFISQGNLVLEHPITVHERQTGKSTIGLHTAFDTILEIINLVLLFNPLKIFLPLSIACIVIGMGWGIPFVLLGHGVSVGAMLAIVIGLLFFILGLIASQLSAIRICMLENPQQRDQTNEDK